MFFEIWALRGCGQTNPDSTIITAVLAGSSTDKILAVLHRSDAALAGTLKTLTSLNKEARPFFLGDNSIWSFPSVSSLSDYSIWRS